MDLHEARAMLQSKSVEERERACDWLGDPAQQEALLELVTDSDPGVRRYAVWALGRTAPRTPELDAALVEALRDEDGEVRAIAADGVYVSGAECHDVAATLIPLLDDSRVGETRVFLALEAQPDSATAIPRAIDALVEQRPSAYAALRMLLKLNEDTAEIEKAVRCGLDHSNATVRSLARRWLASHGHSAEP
ncbi:MAG: HEAT repeat domain-containing protein [Planctomycetota bacterium]|nr:HEAT repeat domain-containing protein [Planctomycetota bacterium]